MPRKLEWTIRSVLEWTSGYFTSHHIDSPRITAEVLLAHTLNLKRIDLYLRYDQPLLPSELADYRLLVQRRRRHEPVAYIVGRKEFWSLDFAVNPAVLIPRPDTECLVETALRILDEKRETERVPQILELGTGSGAVIIALASERPECRFFASDVSPAAVSTARENAIRNRVSDRISFFCGDWFTPLKPFNVRFDLIVSNPPYIRSGDMSRLAPDISRFEPRNALESGAGGLDAIGHIIERAPAFAVPGATVLLEIGHDQRAAVEAVGRRSGMYHSVDCKQDYGGHDRVMRLTLQSR